MNVSSICTRNVVTIDRAADLAQAAELMREHHVGYIVVTDSRRATRVPVGVITDRDIVVKVIARDVDAHALAVGDVMSPDPVMAEENDDVATALQRMRAIGVRRLPVVRHDRELAGVVSIDDVVDRLAAQLGDVAGSIRNEQQIERRVRP